MFVSLSSKFKRCWCFTVLLEAQINEDKCYKGSAMHDNVRPELGKTFCLWLCINTLYSTLLYFVRTYLTFSFSIKQHWSSTYLLLQRCSLGLSSYLSLQNLRIILPRESYFCNYFDTLKPDKMCFLDYPIIYYLGKAW